MRSGNRYGRVRRRLTLIIVTANTCGAALIAFYFSNLHSGDWPGFFTGTSVGQLVLIIAMVGLLILGNVASGRLLGPLWAWYRRAVETDSVQISPKIQSLALSLPAISAGIVMMMWFLAGLAFGILGGFDLINYQWYWGRFFQVLIGSEVAGSVTMVLTYFAVERAWCSELPLFFAGAEMTKTPAFRMRVRTRLLVLFIITVAPLIDLAALSYGQAVQIAGAPQPAALLPRLLRLEVFLVSVGLLTAIVLARTLGASLIQPLEALSKRMRKVEEGDLNVRVVATSNDEIGVMSQCFNSMVEGLKRRDVELRTIYQISQDITASLELDQTLQTVLEQVGQMIAYDGAEICLREEEGGLRARAWAGLGQAQIRPDGRVYQPGEGYTGWIGERRQSLLVPDVDVHQEQQPVVRQIADGVMMNSYLGVPLLAGQKVVGTLELAGARKGAFDEHSRQLLETIAPQAAIAIDNAVQVQERERHLKEQIAQLRIQIDQSKRDRQVAEIAETDYFQQLQEKAQQMREDRAEKSGNRLTKPGDSV